MCGFHIYTLGNDRVFDDVAVLINSIRYFNPEIGITLIPWDDNIERCKVLCSSLNVKILIEDLSKYDALGAGFSHDFEKGRRIFRKFAAFAGPYSRFLFLDADCIVLSSLKILEKTLEKSDDDILFYAHAAPNRNFTSVEFKAFAKQTIGHAEGYNAAFFLSHKELFSFEFLSDVARKMLRLEQGLGLRHEQAFLNYCSIILSMKTNLVAHVDRGVYAAWDTAARIIERDGKFFFESRNQPAISILHYSSPTWRTGPNRELYQRFMR